MGPKRIIVLSIAGASALIALFLIRGLATGKENKAPPPAIVQAAPALVYVAVAGRDISVGDRIAESDLTWQPWPAGNVNPDYVTNGAVPNLTGNTSVGKAAGGAIAVADSMKQRALGMQGTPGEVFLGGVAKEIVRKGEPVVLAKIVRAGQSGVMAVRLEPGMRAMAIPLSPESSAGGFVLPGDHVDVVQVRKLDGGVVTSNTVMKNVRVLAIDQNTATANKGSTLGATATLEVAPGQAENLVLARAQGDLTLVLRSYADVGGPTVDTMINRAKSLVSTPVVRVYRNAAATEVKVAR
jgi:pilus assembly protein CpaB